MTIVPQYGFPSLLWEGCATFNGDIESHLPHIQSLDDTYNGSRYDHIKYVTNTMTGTSTAQETGDNAKLRFVIVIDPATSESYLRQTDVPVRLLPAPVAGRRQREKTTASVLL